MDLPSQRGHSPPCRRLSLCSNPLSLVTWYSSNNGSKKSLNSGALCWPYSVGHDISTPSVQFSSVQSLSHLWLFATPWIAARQAFLSITSSWSSLRLTSINSVIPSSHLILCCPLLLLPPIPPSISLYQWVNYSHDVAKVLEFQL